MAASPNQSHERRIRAVRNRNIAMGVLAGVMRHWLTGPGPLRSRLMTNVWIERKRYAATRVQNIELSRIRGIDRVRVDGPVWRHSPLVVAALSTLLECEMVFEFGRDTGETAWLLAHNLPNARIVRLEERAEPSGQARLGAFDHVHHLSRGDHGLRLDANPDASRITHLSGDSFTFDFVQYSGTADLVYIEGSSRYAHVESDTAAAFGLLSELGAIVWDGYSGDPGVYAFLNELASSLDRPIFHILGTRLALYSRWDLVTPEV